MAFGPLTYLATVSCPFPGVITPFARFGLVRTGGLNFNFAGVVPDRCQRGDRAHGHWDIDLFLRHLGGIE
jgi:hypothetical protein